MPASNQPKIRRKCSYCNRTFWSNNIRKIYCSSNCNVYNNRDLSPKQKEMKRVRSREYYRKLSKSDRKNLKLQSRYGISLKEFKTISKKQKGKCAICFKKLKLSVDHCHKSGMIRSLLCNGCNRGLGYFSENPKALREAANYIERFKR
jgi:hypothetical protein